MPLAIIYDIIKTIMFTNSQNTSDPIYGSDSTICNYSSSVKIVGGDGKCYPLIGALQSWFNNNDL